VAWTIIETWSGIVATVAGWNAVESWTGIVNAPAQWKAVEVWAGTVNSIPAVWRNVESWTGNRELSCSLEKYRDVDWQRRNGGPSKAGRVA
jgi:hypothetical protein